MNDLALTVPPELVEAIAERVAAILEERSPAVDGSPWMTVDEAAEYLRLRDRQRVYDLKSAGRLPAGGDGRSPRFHRAVLDAYLAGGDPWAVAERLPGPGEPAWKAGRAPRA